MVSKVIAMFSFGWYFSSVEERMDMFLSRAGSRQDDAKVDDRL